MQSTSFGAEIRDSFDHLTTGFELLGQHRDLSCESCHANAVFKGTPRDCSACHGVGTAIRATAKTANHILSTDRCDSCHTPIAWKPAVNFDHAEARGSCSTCHNNIQAQGKGPQHIDTNLECDACHSTISWAGAVFRHDGVTSGCASCHNGIQATGMPSTHIPVNGAACEGCHSTSNFTTFAGTTMNHAAVAGMPCATCHEAGNTFFGVTIVTRPGSPHPSSGDCAQCHGSTTSFATNSLRPANHIPTTAPCEQCHTTPDNFALYSVTGTHQGVTDCLSCHGPAVATTFANVTITTTGSTHIPIGNLDCNGSGCHSASNVNSGGFSLGSASINSPTLSTAGHATVAGVVPACQTCHQTASYLGMIASSTAAGDSRPSAALDATHPTSGDCGSCHTTTPTFATDVTAGKPANHIPTNAPCAQCHTTAGNYALYSVTGTHQGVTNCLSCHGSTVAATFANVTIATTPANHIPIGNLDCNGSGCHSTSNLNAGGFNIGSASITAPTLSTAGHATVGAVVPACQTCHQTAAYLGMITSSTTAGDSRPSAGLDAMHPAAGDCGTCHTTTPTFATDVTSAGKPGNHIPTNAPCAQCHTTAGNYALYSVTGTHQGVTNCLSCHGPTVAATFANVTITTTSANHIPIGALDCNGAGCHSTGNVNAGGFNIGSASINSPTLTTAGHTTVAGAVPACQTCHEAAPYQGMIASSATTAGDSRPSAALDAMHPTAGDCGSCHLTVPTFASDVVAGTKPANHIPTTAACTQCHTTAGNFALYSVTGTHQGVTNCLSCHAPSVAGTFVNVTITTTSANHIPIGALDCNGSGCHTTSNVNTAGFNIGAASINSPTLNTTGHATVAGAVPACQTCHESAPYQGMIVSSASTAGDSRPTAFDKIHPTAGDCGTCHTTTPTFASDQTSNAKPANHIPTNAACAQCHTTAGNFALYSVTATHQGVTNCLTCHGPSVAGTFANITITTTSANHIPIGSLDCNGSGCHTTGNVNAGGFNIGSPSITAPTLSTTGHATVAGVVPACQTCHESAPYQGMVVSSASTAGDSRPTALDKNHPTAGDCGTCHTTTPTFASDVTSQAKPTNHIPTNAACAQCHTTAGNYALYSVTGTHQGVTNCLTCHGPSVAATFANITITTTSANHIPIGTLDCNGSGCHTTGNVNTGGFHIGSASINSPTLTTTGHATVAGVVPACQTCHESAPYQGMIASSASTAGDSRPTALDKSHPTTGDCGGCHTSTPTFASNVTSGVKPTNHIPTNAPCAQCHTTAGNFAAYVMGAAGHAGITNGCALCHASGLSFANMAPPTLVEPPTGATGHVPVGSVACEQCHSVTTFTTFAGTVMKHTAVRGNACDSCHERGMTWKTNTGVQLWVRPSANHHAGQDCGGSGCHTSRDKRALRPVVAASRTATTTTTAPASNPPVKPFRGIVSTPRNSLVAGGDPNIALKPANHIATSNLCQACHTTLAWLPVRTVDHMQVRGTCASCHDGHTAKGKSSAHIASSPACENCHTTNAWTPARVDHASVAPRTCISCHNSVRAIGLPRNHLPTAQQCDSCHGTLAWLPAKLDHSAITNGCAACHNNTIGVGKPTAHLATQRDCSTCHSYSDWSVIRFQHASAAYPGNHRSALACVACHTSNTDQIPYPSPASAGTCGGCHAKDFKPAAHPKSVGGETYTAGELSNCTGSCHVYTDSTRAKISKSVPGPHHRVSDATFKH